MNTFFSRVLYTTHKIIKQLEFPLILLRNSINSENILQVNNLMKALKLGGKIYW